MPPRKIARHSASLPFCKFCMADENVDRQNRSTIYALARVTRLTFEGAWALSLRPQNENLLILKFALEEASDLILLRTMIGIFALRPTRGAAGARIGRT